MIVIQPGELRCLRRGATNNVCVRRRAVQFNRPARQGGSRLPGRLRWRHQGPDLRNVLRQSYDYLATMPKLRSTYDGRLIYQTSCEERKAFLRYDLLAKS